MFDVNDHPMQDALNTDIAKVLANTVNSLRVISKGYNVDGIELAKQFRACLDRMIEHNMK